MNSSILKTTNCIILALFVLISSTIEVLAKPCFCPICNFKRDAASLSFFNERSAPLVKSWIDKVEEKATVIATVAEAIIYPMLQNGDTSLSELRVFPQHVLSPPSASLVSSYLIKDDSRKALEARQSTARRNFEEMSAYVSQRIYLAEEFVVPWATSRYEKILNSVDKMGPQKKMIDTQLAAVEFKSAIDAQTSLVRADVSMMEYFFNADNRPHHNLKKEDVNQAMGGLLNF